MRIKIREFAYAWGKSMLVLLSNTVIMVPFLLFLSLNDGIAERSVLPFALYYTCRILGVFLIRAIKNTISSLELLILSLYTGLAGSVLAFIGPLNSWLYLPAGILIGLSASWLPTATVTLNHFQPNTEKKTSYPLLLLALIALFAGLTLSGTLGLSLSFGLYILFYAIALGYAYEAASKQVLTNKMKPETALYLSKKDLFIFTGLCLLLILLRAGRLLSSALAIGVSLLGFSFFFVFLIYKTRKEYRNYQIPLSLNVLTFLNGAVGNFLFLFGSLYVINIFGKGSENLLLYLPYALGMVFALATYKEITHLVPYMDNFILLGLGLGLLMMLVPSALSFSFFLLSYGHFLLNKWLNNQYFMALHIPEDHRILLKNTTQKKGSLIHQFFLIIFLLLLTEKQNNSKSFFLQLINPQSPHLSAAHIFYGLALLSIAGFLILIVSYFYLKRRKI